MVGVFCLGLLAWNGKWDASQRTNLARVHRVATLFILNQKKSGAANFKGRVRLSPSGCARAPATGFRKLGS